MRKTITVLICVFSFLAATYIVLQNGCLIKRFIGIPCPTCGMTRAWLSVFHGQIANAFAWHPLFWMVPLAIVYLYFRRYKAVKKWDVPVIAASVSLLLGIYIYRMVTMFPVRRPMDFNGSAIVYLIIHKLFGL